MKVAFARVESFNSAALLCSAKMKTVAHLEGRTRLVVPSVSLEAVPPPTSPVFFNPMARLNRDVTVSITEGTGGGTFCDSMAGCGARGVRVAREVKRVHEVALVDFNRAALKMAREAAALNRVSGKCRLVESETSSFLFSRYGRDRRFDYVDVDPFGSPIGQVQGALNATADGGILSVTATDTAVLCGVYPGVAIRRYGGVPLNNRFNHETAVRLLSGTICRIAASIDVGARPVAAHSTKHYVRLYLRVNDGASKADAALDEIGYVSWCPACGNALASRLAEDNCPACGRRARRAGPLWIGGMTEGAVLEASEKAATRSGLEEAAALLHGLSGSDGYPPWSFSVEGMSSSLGVATAPEAQVRSQLRKMGYSSMRTPYERTGLKTEAPARDVMRAVKEAARARLGGQDAGAAPN